MQSTEQPATARQPLHFGPLDYATVMAFLSYSASVTITPICLVILSRELGFSLTEGGAWEMVRGSLALLLLVSSGFLAAHFGKLRALAFSAVALSVGLIVYAFSPSYLVLMGSAAVLGVGGGVIEALLNPLVQDLHPNDSGRYLNISNGFWSIGVLLTVLVGGELLTRSVSWRPIVGAVAVVATATALLFVVHARRGGKLVPAARQQPAVGEQPAVGQQPAVGEQPAVGSVTRQVVAHKVAVLKNRRFWAFAVMMFAAGGAEGAFTFWSASYIQLVYADSAYSSLPRLAGIGTACFAGGMIVGRFVDGWLVPQSRLWLLLVLSAGGALVTSLFFPQVQSLGLLFAVLFVAGLFVACFWPSLQSYAVDRIRLDPTTLFILLSCAGIPGFAGTSWIMGYVGDRAGLRTSFLVVPVLLAVLLVLLIVERLRPPVVRTAPVA